MFNTNLKNLNINKYFEVNNRNTSVFIFSNLLNRLSVSNSYFSNYTINSNFSHSFNGYYLFSQQNSLIKTNLIFFNNANIFYFFMLKTYFLLNSVSKNNIVF